LLQPQQKRKNPLNEKIWCNFCKNDVIMTSMDSSHRPCLGADGLNSKRVG